MKKLLIIVIFPVVLLCGCGAINSNFREVEHLLVIQTMGIDKGENGVAVSLASAADKTRGPVRLSAEGESVTSAIDRIERRAFEEELFCAHINHILIGEDEARDGIDEILQYICRSPDIRIDVPLYIVQGGTAGELVTGVGDQSVGASEILDGIQVNLDGRDDCRSFTASEVARSLARHGSALICAVSYTESAEDGENESRTAEVTGYGVIRNGALCAFLDRDQAIGTGFLLNDVGVSDISLNSTAEKPISVEIDRGSSEITPVMDDSGALTGLDIFVHVGASVVETAGDAAGEDYITARLEAAISERIRSVLLTAKELGSDFLGLGSYVERAMPDEYAALGDFGALLPDLEIRLHVSGSLNHTNDLKGV